MSPSYFIAALALLSVVVGTLVGLLVRARWALHLARRESRGLKERFKPVLDAEAEAIRILTKAALQETITREAAAEEAKRILTDAARQESLAHEAAAAQEQRTVAAQAENASLAGQIAGLRVQLAVLDEQAKATATT